MAAALRRVCVVLLAVLLAAGCADTVRGKAVADPVALKQVQEAHTPLTAQAALGDFKTVDYCTIFDPSSIRAGGGTDPGQPVTAFDDCTIDAKLGTTAVQVFVGYLQGKQNDRGVQIPDPTKTLPRGLSVARSPGERTYCEYYLRFPDGVSLEVETLTAGEVSGADLPQPNALCRLSSAALDGVAAAVQKKPAGHQTFAANSLGTLDACSLVADDQVNTELGVAAQKTPTPSGHRCRWAMSGGSASVSLSFLVDTPPQPVTGSTTETLGGKPSLVTAYSPTLCSVQVGLGPAAGAKNGEVEQADLFVSTTSIGKDACAIGRDLANAAWPKLPV
jgi:hypothetical protein